MSQPESPKRAAPPQDATSQAARAANRLLRSAQQWLEGSMQKLEGEASEDGPSNHAAGRDVTVVAVTALSALILFRGAAVWTMRVLGALLVVLVQCLLSSVVQELVANWIKDAAEANTPTLNASPKPPPEGAVVAPALRADQEQDKPPPRKELPTPPCAQIACGNNERMQAAYVNEDLCKNTQYVPRICQSTKLPFWWGTNGASHNKYRLVYRRRSPAGTYEYGQPSLEADVKCKLFGRPALYFEFVSEVRAVRERYGSDVELVLQKKDLMSNDMPAPWLDIHVFPDPDIKALLPGNAGHALAPEELRGAIWLFLDHCGYT